MCEDVGSVAGGAESAQKKRGLGRAIRGNQEGCYIFQCAFRAMLWLRLRLLKTPL